MARPPRGSDLVSVLRGLSRVGSAVVDVRSQEVTKAWATSSLRPLIMQGSANLQEAISKAVQQPQVVQVIIVQEFGFWKKWRSWKRVGIEVEKNEEGGEEEKERGERDGSWKRTRRKEGWECR